MRLFRSFRARAFLARTFDAVFGQSPANLAELHATEAPDTLKFQVVTEAVAPTPVPPIFVGGGGLSHFPKPPKVKIKKRKPRSVELYLRATETPDRARFVVEVVGEPVRSTAVSFRVSEPADEMSMKVEVHLNRVMVANQNLLLIASM